MSSESYKALKYNYYPLVWMRALRLAYQDQVSFLRKRFKKDKSITIHETNTQTTSDQNFHVKNWPVI